METQTSAEHYPFLAGGGELGELTRAVNWSSSPLGPPKNWPLSLRTTLGIVLHSASPMLLFWGEELICFYNDAFRPSLGTDGRHPGVGKPASAVWSESWDFIGPLLTQVMATGEPVWLDDQLVPMYRNGRLDDVYWTCSYSPAYDDDGQPGGVLVTCTETTERVTAVNKLQASEQRFRHLIESAPMATAIFRGPTYIIELANEAHLQLWGRRAEEVLNRPLFEALPEAGGQGYEQILDHVLATGEPFYANELHAPLVRHGKQETVYFNFVYQALREADGTITGVIVVANDITTQVAARQKIEESEARLRSLVENAPFPIGVYVGREMRIQLANQSILDIWGKGNDVIGKLYSAILPELENQAIFTQLDSVFTTGVPFHAKNQRVDLVVAEKVRPYYFNYSFTPLYDADGQVYGVMNTAADVTDLALAKQQVDETEATLRGAIEMAELGTWEFDPATGITQFSDRLRAWFGFAPGELVTADRGYRPIRPADRLLVERATQQAIQPGGDGNYEVEFTLEAPQAGQERIIYSVGKLRVDEYGQPHKLVGTARDVTKDRQLQQELERQVQERTEEMEVINEELLASSEELVRANQELTETNNLLTRSNENLQQFAYVASHDLQEPLRKIKQFGDLLKDGYGPQLGEGLPYLERMQAAATRMSTLIRDLLTYSRIATQRDTSIRVPLQQIVDAVMVDLDVLIQETGADLTIDALPVVDGDPMQLGQLFQNVLSNALKFRRPDVTPLIRVSARQVTFAELPPSVRPARLTANYHLIEVSDNGIGFDDKYVDRIFQVFQRLHSQSQYPGTGIGLAICEKVVVNHGGAIMAISQPGQGTTFSIYLPA